MLSTTSWGKKKLHRWYRLSCLWCLTGDKYKYDSFHNYVIEKNLLKITLPCLLLKRLSFNPES